ncbi:hypothetical protein MNV49_004321 [Pseudohyphozyma bogoriensis]|nr:hypothetical protein MNV49_004321 [Pseudohyphozyma bogoriensis]
MSTPITTFTLPSKPSDPSPSPSPPPPPPPLLALCRKHGVYVLIHASPLAGRSPKERQHSIINALVASDPFPPPSAEGRQRLWLKIGAGKEGEDGGENAGLLEDLEGVQVVRSTGTMSSDGAISYPLVELLIPPAALANVCAACGEFENADDALEKRFKRCARCRLVYYIEELVVAPTGGAEGREDGGGVDGSDVSASASTSTRSDIITDGEAEAGSYTESNAANSPQPSTSIAYVRPASPFYASAPSQIPPPSVTAPTPSPFLLPSPLSLPIPSKLLPPLPSDTITTTSTPTATTFEVEMLQLQLQLQQTNLELERYKSQEESRQRSMNSLKLKARELLDGVEGMEAAALDASLVNSERAKTNEEDIAKRRDDVARAENRRLAQELQAASAELSEFRVKLVELKGELESSRRREEALQERVDRTVEVVVVEDDSTELREQLQLLNSHIDDFVFSIVESVNGVQEVDFETRFTGMMRENVLDNAAMKGYFGLAAMHASGENESTVGDFLMDGFKTVVCRTLDKVVFRPFKVGLPTEEDDYLRRVYASMLSVNLDKAGKWRTLTYPAVGNQLPPSDDSFQLETVDSVTQSLLEHFDSVFRHFHPSTKTLDLSPSQTQLRSLTREALRWRERSRMLVSDYEPFLRFEDVKSSAGSVHSSNRNSVMGGEKTVVGFGGFGLSKLQRVSMGGESFQDRVVILAGQEIVNNEG